MNRRILYRSGYLILAISWISLMHVSALSISIQPEKIIQGYPVMISIDGTSTLTGIRSLAFGSQTLPLFLYKNAPHALYGVDLNKKVGTYTIKLTLKDGTVMTKDMEVIARERVEAPLGIPEKLGGNTAKSEKTLVDTLALENASLLNLRTSSTAYWKLPFAYPTANPIVTDDYGYTRQTGSYTIAHKGTDFKAVTGTKIMAMNRGVVRVAKTYRNYGKTVVVDHGQGVMTFYMHLSKINVNVGELVKQGQVLGLSGKTGYAESPHLHLTVRIKDVSIDPVLFIKLFDK